MQAQASIDVMATPADTTLPSGTNSFGLWGTSASARSYYGQVGVLFEWNELGCRPCRFYWHFDFSCAYVLAIVHIYIASTDLHDARRPEHGPDGLRLLCPPE
jgi:hypothetical protein